jgi:coproporphyrinogen III oxidase-like Fe-S oxidoreductase
MTNRLGDAPLQTVFFGGGTPSLVPPNQLERIISLLSCRFGLEPSAEISMEADPGTFDVQRLRDYMNLGVSRFSVGIQAFQQVCPPLLVFYAWCEGCPRPK